MCVCVCVCTGYERWAILHVLPNKSNWEKHRESKIVCPRIISSLDLEHRAICRTCPFMIHDSCRVWARNKFRRLGMRGVFRGRHVGAGLAQKSYFFLVCGLQFKLCLFQFWPLWSVKLLLNDDLSILQIHSVNRNPHINYPQVHFVPFY